MDLKLLGGVAEELGFCGSVELFSVEIKRPQLAVFVGLLDDFGGGVGSE